jgi:hypothetical protein
VLGSRRGAPTVKKVTLMFSSLIMLRTSCAYSGEPSSMAKAKLLGRLHAKTRLPEGSLVGTLKFAGTDLTISILVRVTGSVF